MSRNKKKLTDNFVANRASRLSGLFMAGALAVASITSPFMNAAEAQTRTPPVAASVARTATNDTLVANNNAPAVRIASADTAATIAPIVDRGPHRVETGPNYKIIRMHHPRSEADAATGPAEAMKQDAIVILNYTDRTDPLSLKQLAWLEQALPTFAARSSRPLVLLDVTAFDKDFSKNIIYTAYMPSLMAAQMMNTLDNGKRMPYDPEKDNVITPYGVIHGAGGGDFSASLYPHGSSEQELRSAVLSNVIRAIKATNAQVAQTRPTTIPSGTLAAVNTPGTP